MHLMLKSRRYLGSEVQLHGFRADTFPYTAHNKNNNNSIIRCIESNFGEQDTYVFKFIPLDIVTNLN